MTYNLLPHTSQHLDKYSLPLSILYTPLQGTPESTHQSGPTSICACGAVMSQLNKRQRWPCLYCKSVNQQVH
jgi:hypothetical protein